MRNLKKILYIFKIFLLPRGLARKNKIVFSIFTIIVFLFASIYIYNAFHPGSTEAAWWNDNWAYRKSIAITNNTSEESNVYINLTGASAIDTSTAGRFQSDCGDLRFTKQNGELLKYYIVSGCGTATTVVHVSFNTFPAGDQTIYYYYGNPSAANGFLTSDFSTEASNYTIGSQGSEEKSQGPMLYFAFDEGYGTSTKDFSQNKITGAFSGTGGPSWKPTSECIVGNCLYFNGSSTTNNQTVTFSQTSPSPTNITGDVTISAWIRPTSNYFDTAEAIVRNGQGADLVYSLFYDPVNKRPYFHWYDGSFKQVSASSNTAPLNQWTHVEIVRSGTNLSFYINGKLDSTSTVTTPTVAASQFAVGRTNNAAVPQDYTGFLDELKVYNYARSAVQVKADFVSRGSSDGAGAVLGVNDQSSLSNGLVGYWKMDEVSGAGSTLADSSGNSNNGTAVLWGGGNTATDSAHVAGKFGNGFSFDGGDDYIDVGSPLGSSQKSRTYSIWVKPTAGSSSSRDGILGENGGSRIDYGNGVGTSSFHALILFTGGTTTELTGTGLGTNNWNHLALSIDNEKGIIRFYVNGLLTSTQTWDINTKSVSNSTTHFIGRVNGASKFPGTMDDARVYNRALSGAEVSQLYNFAPGPVGYYNFEEGQGNTLNDKSGNGNTGTWSGTAPYWTQGKYGKGGSFNGSNDLVTVTDTDNLSFGNGTNDQAFSLGVWAKISQVSGTGGVIAKATSATAGEYYILLSGGGLYFRTVDNSTGGYIGIATTVKPPTNEWIYISTTYDGSGANTGMKMYINGVQQSTNTSDSGTYVAMENTSANFQIGKRDVYFPGQLDEVRVYNYARTQKQIVEDMNAGHPSVGSPVGSAIGHWKFDEGYGTTAKNSGNGGAALNGTLNNMASPATATSGWQQAGKFGKALGFNKGTTYVDMGNPTALQLTSDMTLSAWVYPSEFTSVGGIMTHSYNTNGNRGYGFGLDSSGRLTFRASSDGTSVSTTNGTASVSLNSWSYVTAVYNAAAGSVSYYINGKLDRTVTGLPNSIYNPSRNFQVGAWDSGATGSNLFSGLIDEPKIYNYALTADEIKLDMNQGKSQVWGALSDTSGLTGGSVASNSASAEYCVPGDTSSCAPPIGRWDFEEGTGNSANDSSGNGNTGTWNGTAPYWTQGKYGKGGAFNGSDNYVSLGSTSSLTITGSMTASIWINAPSPSAITASFARFLWTSDDNFSLFYRKSSGCLELKAVATNDNRATVCGGSIPANTWYYATAVYDQAAGKAYLYVNGVLQSSVVKTGSLSNNHTWYIGSTSSTIQGRIDRVTIYDYARTPAQVAWDYNRGAPVGHWKMDECQGGSINDSSLNKNVGAITIGATGTQASVGTCNTSSTAWGNGATGKFNSSLNFDGTDDYVTMGDVASLEGLPAMTVSAWINPASLTGNRDIIQKENTYNFRLVNSQVQCWVHNGTSYVNIANATLPTGIGTWANVACTWNGGTGKVYINGKDLTSSSNSATTMATNSNSVTIGSRVGTSEFFSGQIDDVRIYNYALTSSQIKQVMNQGSGIRFGPNTGTP